MTSMTENPQRLDKAGADSLPTPDLPLLRKILSHIDAHPTEYDQTFWVSPCGTAYCIAGTALVMTGHSLTPHPTAGMSECLLDGLSGGLITASGSSFVHETARRELGLTDDEAYDLFDEQNRRADVQETAERIAARAGEVL